MSINHIQKEENLETLHHPDLYCHRDEYINKYITKQNLIKGTRKREFVWSN
jgi:hypothetical protein